MIISEHVITNSVMIAAKVKPYKIQETATRLFHVLITWKIFFPLIPESLLKVLNVPGVNWMPYQFRCLDPFSPVVVLGKCSFELCVCRHLKPANVCDDQLCPAQARRLPLWLCLALALARPF